MKTAKNKIVLIVVGVMVGIISFKFVTQTLFSFDKGHQRMKACESLKAPISKEELYEKMGEPYEAQQVANGVIYLYEGSRVAAGPIRILISDDQKQVTGTMCSEDGQWVSLAP